MQYPTKSFSASILATLLPFIILVSIFYSLLIFGSIRLTEDHFIISYLEREIALVEQHFESAESFQLPTTSYLEGFLGRDNTLPEICQNKPVGYNQNHISGRHVMLRDIVNSDLQLCLVLDESMFISIKQHEEILAPILYIVGGLVLIASSLVAILIARRIAHPINQLAGDVTSETIDATRFYGLDRTDEVGQLSRSLSELVQQLQHAIEREKSFTRHTSHELRTPIAVIRNALAVLRLAHENPEKRQRNFERIETACGDMENMVTLFLCLGRENKQQHTEAVPLQPVITRYLEKYQQVIRGHGTQVNLHGDPDAHVPASGPLLDILINNLLRNALSHGEREVTIAFNNERLQVTNPIRLTEQQEENGFGYGLDIIQRICEYADWQMTITRNAEDNTFCARIDFTLMNTAIENDNTNNNI